MKRLVSFTFAIMLLFSASICSAMGFYPTTPPNVDLTTGETHSTTTSTQQTQQDLANLQNFNSMLSTIMKNQQDMSLSTTRNLGY
jgi:hypothetical protein